MRQRAMAARALAVFCAALLGPGAAAVAKDSPRREVRDLHYGDVLFQFFQDDYFDAVVRLEAARDFGRLPNHAAEAELLAGGMYLSLGLYSEADRIFNRLLAGSLDRSVADRAFFYLARIGYQRGHYEQAARNLARIQGPLPGELEPERRLLESNVLMALGRYADAAAALKVWDDESSWAAFARFNLGVALVRSGDSAQGRMLLESVGNAAGGLGGAALAQGSREPRARFRVASGALGRGGRGSPEPRQARRTVHEPGVARSWLGGDRRRASRSRAGPLAGAARPAAARFVRAGVAARGAVRVCPACLERSGRAALPAGRAVLRS